MHGGLVFACFQRRPNSSHQLHITCCTVHLFARFCSFPVYVRPRYLDNNPLVSLTQLPMGGMWQTVFFIMCLEWVSTYVCPPPKDRGGPFAQGRLEPKVRFGLSKRHGPVTVLYALLRCKESHAKDKPWDILGWSDILLEDEDRLLGPRVVCQDLVAKWWGLP